MHMKLIDRFIHQSVNRKQLTKGLSWVISRIGAEGESTGNELTEPKTQRQVVLNVIGKLSLREQREDFSRNKDGIDLLFFLVFKKQYSIMRNCVLSRINFLFEANITRLSTNFIFPDIAIALR